jgi:hypothetical protein
MNRVDALTDPEDAVLDGIGMATTAERRPGHDGALVIACWSRLRCPRLDPWSGSRRS